MLLIAPRSSQNARTQRFWNFKTALWCVFGVLSFCVVGWTLGLPTTRASLQTAAPPGASQRVQVTVPAAMRTSPFNTARYLNVPPNFAISVYARIPQARFMAIAPNGDLLVSQPDYGKVSLVRPNPNGNPIVSDLVIGLRRPHDLVFHVIGGTTYLFVSETHQVNRYVYANGGITAGSRELVVVNLPDAETPGELQGRHNHALKNIAIDSQHRLYVSSASASNADPSDLAANPKRAAIYTYDARATNVSAENGTLFAQGIRNAEGLAFLPGTDELWVVVNNRDNIAYPFHNDFDGDGTDDYGKVLPSYVDNHPPEEFTRVRSGGHYGWPFANPNPDNGLDEMPFDLDVQNNPNGARGAAESFDRITKGIQAHSAPLGLSFLQGTNFPAAYRNGAVVGYHGSWNRTRRTGYKVAYFPWIAATNAPGDEINLVTGWVNDADQSVWGRPVDAVPATDGSLFITDDQSGTVYKLTYTPPAPTPTATATATPTATATATPTPAVVSLTLINADTDQPIAGFDPMPANSTLDFSQLPTRNLSIRANANPATVGSVRFAYNDNPNYKTENVVPYAIAGDTNGDYGAWTPTVGTHTLTATAYSGSGASGIAGGALTIRFTVTEGSGTIANGSYRLIAECSGKALDVKYGWQTDGTDVWQWVINGSAPQRWQVEQIGSGYYRLLSAHSGKVLDVRYAGQADGTDVWQWSPNGSAAQQWQIAAVGNGYYKLLPRNAPGKALDVSGGSSANGANVQIWADNGSPAQRWRIEPVQP